MKYTLMILLSSIWLYANACHHGICTSDIQANRFIHSYDGNMTPILNQIYTSHKLSDQNNPLDVIVIDPGHGGRDKGCSGENSVEKSITLDLSKQLKKIIESQLPEIEVILTRDRDQFLSLKKRADIANQYAADIFISIHCNYLRNAKYFRGSEIFVLGRDESNKESEELAFRENSSIELEESYKENYGGFDPLSPESYILFSMIQSLHLDNSILLASFTEEQLVNSTSVKSKGVKQGAFVVLKETNMPSILVETGYLSNEKDERLLTTKKGQVSVVEGLFNGIVAYKQFVE